MNIAKNSVVSLHYTLKDDKNNELESSYKRDPIIYLHGTGSMIQGLEEALDGRATGEKFKVSVSADKAYGPHVPEMVQDVPKNQFPNPETLQVGMQFQAQSPQGPLVLTIIAVDTDIVKVDGNHPLAGQTLHFDVEVTDIRTATAEEISHGHAHGPGGHDH